MENKKRYKIRSILQGVLWTALGGAMIFLLVAAIKGKGNQRCKGVEINIRGVGINYFVDEADILKTVANMEKTKPVGKTTGSFDLKKMETELEKDVWIKSAELFFDNNEILQITVEEREPIARVFSTTGTSFYVDKELAMLPLSEKYSARLPVFTGFPSDRKVLTRADSSLLLDINRLSLAIQADSFCMAMIEQIDITGKRSFEMIPKIGKELIIFGDATDAEKKLQKLKIFYQEVMVKSGWNRYSEINLRYVGQVVAKIKGAEDIAADSLRALQIMRMISERSAQAAGDSAQTILPDNKSNTVDGSMIQQSIQRDEGFEDAPANLETEQELIPAGQVAPKPGITDRQKGTVPAVKPASVNQPEKKPKAVMQKKNNY